MTVATKTYTPASVRHPERAHDPADPRTHQARYLIGPPRSGTTLVGYLLGGLDGVMSLSEPYLARGILDNWQLQRFYYQFQRDACLCRLRPPFADDPRAFGRFLERMKCRNGFRTLAIKETYRRRGLPSAWLNGPLLDRLVAGGPPIVALIRHPYDVAASTIYLGRWVTGWLGRLIRVRAPNFCSFRDKDHVVEWAADNWTSFVEWARRHQLEPVRYEDIVQDPAGRMREICRRYQFEFSDRVLDYSRPRAAFGGLGDLGVLQAPRPVDKKSIGHGKRLTDRQRACVRRICGHLTTAFDYEL